jgi:hypothetical protein
MARPMKPEADRIYDAFDNLKLDEQAFVLEVLHEKRRTKLKFTSKALADAVAGEGKPAKPRANGSPERPLSVEDPTEQRYTED